ncbi:MAG: hypothetical protein LBG60_14435 [Bifidobacteriaceae bacterium]|nr:hypothetical protein [Bifidobacteriaceae bacterium]
MPVAPGPVAVPGVMASIATERLRRFRATAPGGNNATAMALYTLDADLAAEFYSLFRAGEVLLRETIHRAMSRAFATPNWPGHPVCQGSS